MKRGWLASLLAAAVVLPIAARGADETKTDTKTTDATPAVKAPSNASDTTTKETKGRLPPFYGKLPVDAGQKVKIYEIEATYAPKIKALHEQLASLEAERDEQIKAVLTPEQREKLKTMIAEAKSKHHGKASGDATTKPPDPHKSAPSSSSSSSAPAPSPPPAK